VRDAEQPASRLVEGAICLTNQYRDVTNDPQTGSIGPCSPERCRSMMAPGGRPSARRPTTTSPSILPGDPMIAIIAIAALAGAAYLGLRRPAPSSVERADPNLWPYSHY